MPVRYEVDRSKRLISLTRQGAAEPTLSEFKLTVGEALATIRPERGFNYLVDGEVLVGTAVSTGYLEELLSFLNSIEPCKVAVVARSPAAFGMARMAQTLSERTMVRLKVFVAEVEAEEWLALNDEDSGDNPRVGPT